MRCCVDVPEVFDKVEFATAASLILGDWLKSSELEQKLEPEAEE